MPLCGSENRDPNANTGRQTPVSQRRPHQRSAFNAVVLSPTKRRKQSHEDPKLSGTPDPVKPSSNKEEEFYSVQTSSPGRPDKLLCDALLEVFIRLGVKDLVENAAATCRLWHEVAHSKDLWEVKRAHLRLVDQLLVSEKVVQRRSKGHLFRCSRLGTGEAVLLRVVDLELTNAGKDDGIPTSFLREAALLAKLRHPNIIKYFGSEILGKRAVVCTEFVYENFTQWYKQLEAKASCERLVDIKVKFRQLLTGLAFLHHQGVMHRNLKPDNIFLDMEGAVKIGDLTTTRMLDIPFQAYTPEDPKERDRSGREMRRLWYRAPELILRDEIYGPKVDMWSVGCLLAEAASGRTLFQSDSEIDHLFRVFRLVGTPTCATWPEAVNMKNFSPKFPLYTAFNFAQVARAVECGNCVDQDHLMDQAQPDRIEILQNLFSVATLLGPEGMLALDRLVTIPPGNRASADAALEFSLLCAPAPRSRGCAGSTTPGHDLHPMTQLWLHGKLPGPEDTPEKMERVNRPRHDDTPPAVLSGLGSRGDGCELDSGAPGGCPPVSIPSTLIPSQTVWSILHAMQQHERLERDRSGPMSRAVNSSTAIPLPSLPPGFDANNRAVLIDFIIGLAGSLNLTDYTLHLAASVADKYLALQDEPLIQERYQALGATCLKVADVFAEQSKEYYKQENAQDYAEATLNQTSSEEMLQYEKDVLPKLDFDLHLPTTHWFVQCYLAYGRFTQHGNVAKTATLISDLTLLDYDLLAYLPSLRAQCALVLAVFLVQQAPGRKTRSLTNNPSITGGSAGPSPAETQTSSAAPSPTSSPRGSDALTYLEHWDQNVRNQVCYNNTAHDAAMCLKAVVRTVVEHRREWKSMKLMAVEAKHASLARTLVYPEQFPVYKMVRYIVPDQNRGGLVD